jgi:hypothetical protein
MQRKRFCKSLFGGMGVFLGSHPVLAHKTVLQRSPVAGFQYHRGQAIWPFMRVGEQVSLVREGINSHDRNAIAVYFRNDKLGYVPQRENAMLAQMLDRGEKLQARISRLLEDENPWRRVQFQVSLDG